MKQAHSEVQENDSEMKKMIKGLSQQDSTKDVKAEFRALLDQVEKQFNDLIDENRRLKTHLGETASPRRPLTSTNADSKLVDTDVNVVSFTKKMGAFIDNASTKLKLGRSKNLKAKQILSHRKVLMAHKDSVLDLSASGPYIASSSADCTCKFWDIDSDTCVITYRGHQETVNSCCFNSNDQTYACSASGDGSVHIWCIKHAKEYIDSLKQDHQSKRPSSCTSFDEWREQGDFETSSDNIIYLNKPIFDLKAHEGPVSYACWSHDGKNVVSASWDKTLIYWDVEKAKPVTVLSGHEDDVLHVNCHSSQKMVLSSSADFSFRIWDMRSAKSPVVTNCEAHSAEINSSLFTLGGVVSAGSDKLVKIWDLKNLKESTFSLKTSSVVTRMSINHENMVCLPMRNNHFRIWFLQPNNTGPFISKQTGLEKSLESSCWLEHRGCRYVFTCSIDGAVSKWQVKTPAII